MFHHFSKDISNIPLPAQFTCPFCYSPHLLTIMASNQVQAYINSREDWAEELQQGKMFGVLVLKNKEGEVGFVAAFSGQIQGQNLHEYFVPPVYDLIQEDGFFKKGESKISEINRQIEFLQQQVIFKKCADFQREKEMILFAQKEKMRLAKLARDEKRTQSLTDDELAALIKESQFQKAEYKRLQKKLDFEFAEIQEKRNEVSNQIADLCRKRKDMSNALQRQIFENFVFRNALGESKTALDIWEDQLPPAGAGECAAPRLLQYAYISGLQPIAMAEFWWGKSPKGEIRRHGSFYKACKQKCEPILSFMLQGLDVEQNRFSKDFDLGDKIRIVYEDEWILVVDKPIDVLSVPGNIPQPSVYQWAREKYGEVYVVHRLDMATSGLLLIAKNKDVCRILQQQFEYRQVQKEYVAILDGIVAADSGEINLPMRPDFDERPIQVVDEENGKPAITKFQVLERKDGKTRILFSPKTGRTHQLRVHSAYFGGLDCPIVGDTLYGMPADRLYLHAQKISFSHPHSGEKMDLFSEAPF